MNPCRTLHVVCALVFSGICLTGWAEVPLPPPPTVHTVEQVDDFFGTKVADPYRWMEEDNSPELRQFIDAHNARTRAYLDSPLRQRLRQRVTELLDFPRQSPPVRWGNFAFYSSNTGLQNQSVLHVTEQIGEPGRVLIDPNQLSEDGTISLAGTTYSFDGTLLAWGLARSGSDHSEIRVKNVLTGEDLPDVIPSARQWVHAWKRDNSGFYYGRFPKTTEHGRSEQAYNHQLFFHRLGTAASEDQLIYERPDDPELSFSLDITEDGTLELLYLSRGTKRQNRLYWRPADVGGAWNKLIDHEDFDYRVIENDGSVLYVWTTDGAPRGQVVAIDLNRPEKADWKTILPQTDEVLGTVALVNEKFVVTTMRDAQERLRIYNKDGTLDREVTLPTVGSVGGPFARRQDTDFFYTFTSYTYPPTIFRYDLKTHQQQVHFAPQVRFVPEDYETVQAFATSRDGTPIPVFITFRKDLQRDGSHPAILSAYGGFSQSTTPNFSSSRIAWLERGGVYAQACLRGGGEYGEPWHRAGMLEKKQNVFDDMHAAARLLISEGYTSSARLAIQGGSNGGLLVAACMLQEPQLYGAVVCQVPVTDMLRYHKLGIGRFWTVEYGNAEESEAHFRFLYAYSPLHNVKAGASYPPILITTGEGDNRVVPAHSYKFAAELQSKAHPGNLVLLRVEPKAGHGGGKPTSKILDEVADIYTFLMKTFQMDGR